MQAESSLLYQNHESDNNGLRSPEETHRTINFMLSELVKLQERNDLLRQDIQEAHDRISEIEAATNRLRGGA